MSSIGKLRKNAENYRINQIYKQMTPEQYRQGIENAVNMRTEELSRLYAKDIKKIREEFDYEVKARNGAIRQVMFVELIYELADQLECFVKEPEFLEQKIEKVKGIYENTVKTIEDYTKLKKKGQAVKEFEAKKKKLEKMFNIEF